MIQRDHILRAIKEVPRDHWGVVFLFVLVFSSLGYGLIRSEQKNELLSANIMQLEKQLSITTSVLERSISETHSTLAEELNRERQTVSVIKSDLGNFQQEVGTISSSVDTLEKLNETDPELLQKYSKVYFLSEHYTPERLAAVDKPNLYYEDQPESVHAKMWPHLKELLQSAQTAGVTLWVRSGYRSFDEQTSLKSAYRVQYGSGANTFSADQGYSEHQLGTAVDFITTGLGGNLDGFDTTIAYQWMLTNAHTYGFILSYPQGNSFYVFEPWHWRYVGKELATHLKNTGKSFYDLDQRELDEYLITIF